MESEILLKIAKEAIKKEFDNSIFLSKEEYLKKYPFLQSISATFVTLTLNGNLRGCIGTLEARHSLFDDILTNARNAAFHDPRFYPLTYEEFQKVKIEISLLTKPFKIEYENISDLKNKIKPYIHGVILKKENKRATFLPQVWEQLPSFEDFFSHLCTKANIEENCLDLHPEIYLYEVNKIT